MVTSPSWVDLKDKQPDDNEIVVISYKKQLAIARVFHRKEFSQFAFILILPAYFKDVIVVPFEIVDHWMPLTEPSKDF